MVIGGYEDTSYLDDVELVSINPVLNPVPECLSQLNSLPLSLTGAAGAVDYSRKWDLFQIVVDLQNRPRHIKSKVVLQKEEYPMFVGATKMETPTAICVINM